MHSHVELGGTRLDRGAAAAACWQQCDVYVLCSMLAHPVCDTAPWLPCLVDREASTAWIWTQSAWSCQYAAAAVQQPLYTFKHPAV